jgi:SAM-dependent methyltransferase
MPRNQNTPKDCQLRPDYKAIQSFLGDTRSAQQLLTHYRLERDLAEKILGTREEARGRVYAEVYSELFQSVPEHPQLRAEMQAARRRHIRSVWRRLYRRLKNKTFLEIGCGDAAVAAALAPHTTRTYALDVTDALIDRFTLPTNLDVLLTTGTEIPLADSVIDFAFSDQLMEHLHPEDAIAQLGQIFRVLKPGGSYLCVTPNKVTGPHDVSCVFDYEAAGLHLREYDSTELLTLLKQAGFRKVCFYISAYGSEAMIPARALRLLENCLMALPVLVRARASRNPFIGLLAGLDVVATK